MLALPTVSSSSMPTSEMLVNLAASGDREALKGRGFSVKGVKRVEQDDEWSMSPADKARREAEKIAVRQAEQAVYNSSRAITGDLAEGGGGRGRQSANSSAAAAQAANDRMMARYKQQHVRQQRTASVNSLISQNLIFYNYCLFFRYVLLLYSFMRCYCGCLSFRRRLLRV